VVAVPTSTDPMGILKSTREFKAPGAGKEHTSAVRGGGRDPGVRRPGSGLGRPTVRSKFFRAAMRLKVFFFLSSLVLLTQAVRPDRASPAIGRAGSGGASAARHSQSARVLRTVP